MVLQIILRSVARAWLHQKRSIIPKTVRIAGAEFIIRINGVELKYATAFSESKTMART